MTDPTQFIVNLAHVHKALTHEGVVGIGSDFLTNTPCSLNSYIDQFKHTYVMQHYDGVDADFISSKLNSMTKSAYTTFMPNTLKICFMSTRKNSKNSCELEIFYETTGLGDLSLKQLIQQKKDSNQRFSEEQLISLFWQIADFIYLSGRKNSEFLDITPSNILTKTDSFYNYNFYLTNFGIKGKLKYFHPEDRFYCQNGRSSQQIESSVIFTLGMILLEAATLQSPADLYAEQAVPVKEKNHKTILNQKLLKKRIDSVKLLISENKFLLEILEKVLLQKEESRLKIEDIYTNHEFLKYRKVKAVTSKIDFYSFKTFQGILSYDLNTETIAIGEGLDQELSIHRGCFMKGILEGRCIQESKSSLLSGLFLDNQMFEGQQIKKNDFIQVGKFKNQLILQGYRIYLNIATMTKQNAKIACFVGDFSNGEPSKGVIHYCDGTMKNI